MKKVTMLWFGILIILALIPNIKGRETSYVKIERTSENFEILLLAQDDDDTMGVSVYNKELQQEEIYVWGNNSNKMFNFYDGPFMYYPVKMSYSSIDDLLASGGHVEEMAYSNTNSAVVIEDVNGYDHIFSWGDNLDGKVGSGSPAHFIWEPVEITNNFDGLLEAGGQVTNYEIGSSSPVITIKDTSNNDHIFMWGLEYSYGFEPLWYPKEITNLFYDYDQNIILESGGKITDISHSQATAIIGLEDKSGQDYIYAWGENVAGQAGSVPSILPSDLPTDISSAFVELNEDTYNVKEIETGGSSSSVIFENAIGEQQIYLFGDNHYGQFGLGEEAVGYFTPTNVSYLFNDLWNDDYRIDQIYLDYYTTLIWFTNQQTGEVKILTAGKNNFGQIGINYLTNYAVYEFVDITDNFDDIQKSEILSINVSSNNCYILLKEQEDQNNLYAWGDNVAGQLGIGPSLQKSFLPLKVIIQ